MKRKTYHNQYGGYKTGEISFTPKEIEKLISVCNTLADEIFIKLEVAVGLRREDCAHIKVKNIDFQNNTLTFYEKKKDKTRSIPLPPQLIRLLKQYVQTIPRSQEYLFKCGKSKYGGKTLYNRLQSLCSLAGIPKRPVHSLRASCAKLHLSEGWRIEAVASLLNDLPSTIEQFYSCPSDGEIRELMEKSVVV
ncbi:MAG: site-specific integrase [Methanoregula sp.]|jgi:integrase/recombinase XerD